MSKSSGPQQLRATATEHPHPSTALANLSDSRLGEVISEWPAPGRLLLALKLLVRAVVLAAIAVPVALIFGVLIEGGGAQVLVLLWMAVLFWHVPQILRRLLLFSEQRVAVHQNGVAINDEVLLWSKIQSIQYYGHLHHINKSKVALHTWTFKLSGGGEVLLRTVDDDLGSQIQTERLSQLLEDSVSVYHRYDDEKIVDEHPVRETTAAMRIRDDAASADRGLPITEKLPRNEVIGLLKMGERRRGRRVARLVPKMYATRVACMMMWTLMHLSFGVVFILALEFAMRVFSILSRTELSFMSFDWLGVPAGFPSLLVVGVLCYGFLKLGLVLQGSADKLQQWAAKYRATVDQLKHSSSKKSIQRLEQIWEAEQSFALYLRSFGGEYFRFAEKRAGIAEPLKARELTRDFDSHLVDLIARRSTCFGLANLDDPSPPDGLIQLFVLNKDWAIVADQLTQKAHWIILYLSAESPGLLREMEVLSHLEKYDRVLIVLPKQERDDGDMRWRKTLLDKFPNQIQEGAVNLDEAIAAFMQS